MSTILTGFAQVMVAANYLLEYYKDRHIHYYFLGVALFFILWISPLDMGFIWVMPPILALYLTYILYKKYNTLNHEL